MNQSVTGKYISLKRKEKNLTQSQLAEALGVSNKTVSKWETGRSMPDYSIMPSLCKTLGVSVAELLKGEDSESESAQTYNDEQVLDLLKRTQTLENQVGVISNIVIFKTVRIIALVLLIISGFIAIDLCLNFLWSLLPEVNDGLGVYSHFHYLYFGDDGWSRVGYFEAFKNAAWATFFLLIFNIVLTFRKAKK